MNTDLPLLLRGIEQVSNPQDLQERLTKSHPLRVKVGFDPTAPDLHLGHTVLLHKLRQFQDLGHQAVFLIGDFTARIGDPSGRDSTRPTLSAEELTVNQETYVDQAFKVLDHTRTEVRYNSEWMNKMTAEELLHLASEYTVARMLERDDFSKRYAAQQSIAVHEFLYPLIQGYDSVMLEADVELGGTDQIFNLLMGRELQKHRGQTPQIVMTMPLLEGLDGARKMSKSYDNAIGIKEPPEEMFGKVMSVSDDLMWRYFNLLSLRSEEELKALHKEVDDGTNPRDIKFELAKELVGRFHGSQAATWALKDFKARFRDHQLPKDLEVIKLSIAKPLALPNVLQQVGLCPTTSEARRMVAAGAVQMDQQKVSDHKQTLAAGTEVVLQVGRRRVVRVRLVAESSPNL